MKKVLSGILAAGLIVSSVFLFSSCEQPDALEAYQEAWEKTNQLTELDTSYQADFEIDAQDIWMEVSASGQIQQRLKDGLPEEFFSRMKGKALGMTQEETTYYKDGVLYTDSMGEKIKTEFPMGEFSREMAVSEFPSWFQLDGEIFQECSLKKQGSEQHFTGKVDGEKLKAALLDNIIDSLGEEVEEEDKEEFRRQMEQMADYVTLSDVELTLVITGDGYIGSQGVSMKLKMEGLSELLGDMMIGETEEVSVDMAEISLAFSMTNHQPGKAVSITVPDDLEEYQDWEDYQSLDGWMEE